METKHGFKILARYFEQGITHFYLYVLVDLGSQDWALLDDEPKQIPRTVVNQEFLKGYQKLTGTGVWGEFAQVPGYGKIPYIYE